jgi:D-3-phosphoglycerate dehydrogenase
MNVLVWGREASQQGAREAGLNVAESVEQLFAESDVLSLHLRLNDETRGIVKLADLQRMKPTSLFVNTSRAELIEENALVAALNRGRPGMAAIDVFESEPILQVMPCCAWRTASARRTWAVERESYELYFRAAFQNILDVLAGKHDSIANPKALTPTLAR